MSDVVAYMELALQYAANETQRNMIQAYVDHFKTGDVNKHKLS